MKILYFDLETSPCLGWFWRPGHSVSLSYSNVLEDAKIICASWKWKDEDKVYNANWGPTKNDGLVLKPLIEAMNRADLVIAHNGDRFDLPWVRSRALANRITVLPRWKSMDTLKSVRANLKLPSNRLGDIALYYGLPAKMIVHQDVWKNIVFGDQSQMAELVEYCDNDVRVLQSVHELIEGVVPHKIHQGVVDGGQKWSCPHCGSTHIGHERERVTMTGVTKHEMHCKRDTCRKYFTISSLQYVLYLKQRIKDQK